MLNEVISYAFLALELACGVAIVIRFRGLPRLLGGIAFGVLVATSLTQKVLNAFKVEWWDYNLAFTLFALAAYGCLLATFLTGRVVTGSDGMNNRADTTVPPEDPQLAGIRGWLILPAIGFVLGPVIWVVSLIASLAMFSDVADAGHGGLFALEILVSLGLLSFLIYTVILFFRKKRKAPSMIIALAITNLVVSGLLLVIELGVGAEAFAIQSGKALLRGVISAAIWIPYFKISKRVKATFVQ